jgi:hypothetical protein
MLEFIVPHRINARADQPCWHRQVLADDEEPCLCIPTLNPLLGRLSCEQGAYVLTQLPDEVPGVDAVHADAVNPCSEMIEPATQVAQAVPVS